jgi:imidazolonepropionase-like amidohydrolase
MKKILILLPIALCFVAAAQNTSTVVTPAQIRITHVTLIDTETGKEITDQTVVISGDKISDVANSKSVVAPASAHIVDGRGKYLIPGLWDMHVHGTEVDSTLPVYIANGVTGVRDMFGPPDANKFRAEQAAKHLVSPHIYLGSPIVDGKPPVWPDSIAVENADEARKAVDEQKQRGADFIKVYSLLSREAYFAIIDEAKRKNIPVAGHVPNSITVLEAAEAKQESMEHLVGIGLGCSSRETELRPKIQAASPTGIEFDALNLAALQSYSDERCKAVFSALRKNGNWPVSTLVAWRAIGFLNDPQFTSDNRVRYFSGDFRDWMTGKADARMKEWSASEFGIRRAVFSEQSKLTGELFRAGVHMLAGTDSGNAFCFPGFSLHDELALLVESGVTQLGALQMATRNPALFMNATDKYGSVTVGKIADLVLLDADPLKDIHNTTKISEVFLSGKEFNRAALNQLLKDAENYVAISSSDAASGAESSDVTAVRQQMESLRRAELQYDTTAAEKLLEEDFRLSGADGNVYTKQAFLTLVGDKTNPLELFEYSDMEIHLYDKAAIVFSRLHEKGFMNGKPYELNGRPTWTWIKQNGDWVCVAAHD